MYAPILTHSHIDIDNQRFESTIADKQSNRPTFYPESFHVRFQGSRFQADTAQREQQQSEEQHFAAVFLNKAAEVK